LIGFFLPMEAHARKEVPTNHAGSKQSMGFIENRGQIIDQFYKPNHAVLYLLNTPGMNVQLRRGGFSYDLYRISNIEQRMLKFKWRGYRINHPDVRSATPPPLQIVKPATLKPRQNSPKKQKQRLFICTFPMVT